MDDGWFDLAGTRPVLDYAINTVHTLTSDGAGRAVLVQLCFAKDDGFQVDHFLFDPDLAGQLAYILLGTVHGYPTSPDEIEDEDDTP